MSAVAAIALLTTAACGGGSAGDAGSSGKITLTIADWEFLEPNRAQVWDLLKTYQDTHPNVTLKKEAAPYADYPATMQTQIGGHGGPDLLVMVDSDFAQFANSGVLEPIEDALSGDAKSDLSAVNDQGKVNGHQYGYAWETVIYGFFYNKKLLAQAGVKPPTDVQSFLAAAEAVKKKTGKWGFAARNQLNEEDAWYQDFTGTWIAGYGGSWSKDGQLTINTPENVAAVTAFKKMYDSGAMDTGDDASTFRQKFAQGKVAMMLDNSDALFTMVNNNKVVKSTSVGAAEPPFPTNHSGRQLLLLGVNKYSKHIDAAKAFLNWLYSPEQQRKLASAVAPETVGTSARPPASFAKENPWAPVFWKQVDNGQSLLISQHEDKTAAVGHAIMPEIARVLAGDMTPSEALAKAAAAAQDVVGR